MDLFVCEIAGKNWNFSKIFLENLIFFTRIHDPQILNQIDAADGDPTPLQPPSQKSGGVATTRPSQDWRLWFSYCLQ